MKLRYNDGGRWNSKRPKQKHDCAVRSYAIAMDVPYDIAYDLFKYHGRKNNTGVLTPTFYRIYKNIGYYLNTSKTCQRQKPLKHFLPILSNKLTCVISLEGHVVAYKKGVIHDTLTKKELESMIVEGVWVINK